MRTRPWNMEGLMAARVLAAANAPLNRIGESLDRFSWEIDKALWTLVGRTPDEALYVLNGEVADPGALRVEILVYLRGRRAVEAAQIAAALNVPRQAVWDALQSLGRAGLVDAQDPPQPCGPEAMGWFAIPGAARGVVA